MTTLAISAVVLPVVVAVAAGLMGAFALMRRMTLAADALSHVALPGIGIAVLLRIDPLIGAVVALIAGAVVIWSLERRTNVATEAIIGVVFSAALAAGALLTTGDELVDALFGAATAAPAWESVTGLLAATAVIAFLLAARDRLIVMFMSTDIAMTAGIDVRRLSLLYLLAFALTVALGLRYLGALLMGSLIIIPATAARHVARNLHQMLAISAIAAVLATVAGMMIAAFVHRPTGPLIVAVASALFVIALFIRPR